MAKIHRLRPLSAAKINSSKHSLIIGPDFELLLGRHFGKMYIMPVSFLFRPQNCL